MLLPETDALWVRLSMCPDESRSARHFPAFLHEFQGVFVVVRAWIHERSAGEKM